MTKKPHHMQDKTAYSGVFDITEREAEQLRAKGWLVVPTHLVTEERSGHLHLTDPNGNYAGSRVLDAVQAGDLVRQGFHLTHVAGATADELEDFEK